MWPERTMCCERSVMRSSPHRTWIRSQSTRLRRSLRLASRFRARTFKVDGPLWQYSQRGSFLFVRNPHLPEKIAKKGGHPGSGHVAVGNGENGGSVWKGKGIGGDEWSRAAYLERENARLQRLVAELLVKNEELRRRLGPAGYVATTGQVSP